MTDKVLYLGASTSPVPTAVVLRHEILSWLLWLFSSLFVLSPRVAEEGNFLTL